MRIPTKMMEEYYMDVFDKLKESKERIKGILRDYQLVAVLESLKHLSDKQPTILQAPTGAGKSVMIQAILLHYLCKHERVGVVVHKRELLHQWLKHLQSILPAEVKIGIIADKSYKKYADDSADVQLMMVGCLARRRGPKLSLVIFDVAHHCAANEWVKVFDWYSKRGTMILGATATPKRLDGKPLDTLEYKEEENKKRSVPGFTRLVHGPQSSHLIEQGYLVPVKVFASHFSVSTDGWSVRNGEYNQSLSASEISKINPADVYREWYRHIGPDKLTVCYPASVEYSIKLNNYFNEQIPGISCHIDAKTPDKERERLLDEFRVGNIKVLFQHSIVIEGVDIPSVSCVMCLRPTASSALWLQILGRGLRPASDKSELLLLDFTDNHKKLQMPQDHTIWSLAGDEQTDNISNCPDCKKKRRFEPVELNDFLFYSEILKKCSVCGCEIRDIRYHEKTEQSLLHAKKKAKEKNNKIIRIDGVYTPVLPPKTFDYSAEPKLHLIAKDISNIKNTECHEFIALLHQFRLRRNWKPKWGMFRFVEQWKSLTDKEEPSEDVLYLLRQAFLLEKPPEELTIPNHFDEDTQKQVMWARNTWKWYIQNSSAAA